MVSVSLNLMPAGAVIVFTSPSRILSLLVTLPHRIVPYIAENAPMVMSAFGSTPTHTLGVYVRKVM